MHYLAPHWRLRSQLALSGLPIGLSEWLFEAGSLTRRLREKCTHPFQLNLLSQRRQRPLPDECRAISLDPARRAIIREVQLFCGGTPVVFARSVIPFTSLTGPATRLAGLGGRPLADLLFRDHHTHRATMQYAQLRPSHTLHRLARGALNSAGPLWGRRTVFTFHRQPLLVCEIFSPDLNHAAP